MNNLHLIIALVFFNLTLMAQDTIPKSSNQIVEIYDVVAVYKDHVDGRGRVRQFTSEIKGEIIKYDESTGILTFKDKEGKMYSFSNSEYKYFEYNKEFVKKIKNIVIHPRKSEGFMFSAGLSASYMNIQHNFTPDDYFINGIDSDADLPISLKLGVSKLIDENHLVGISSELALNSSVSSYFNFGARYRYLYDASKNTAFYFPVELKFSHNTHSYQYQVNDTTFTDNMDWSYPTDLQTDITLNAIELNLGQGISFAMKNEKSFSLELMLIKQLMLNERFQNSKNIDPKSEFGITGLKLSAVMNF